MLLLFTYQKSFICVASAYINCKTWKIGHILQPRHLYFSYHFHNAVVQGEALTLDVVNIEYAHVDLEWFYNYVYITHVLFLPIKQFTSY